MSDLNTPSVIPVSKGLIARVQAILLKPAETWDIIAAEPSSIQSIYTGYVIPLAAIGPVCGAIGMSVIGVGAFGFSYHVPIIWAIVQAIVTYVLSLVLLYVQAFIIDALAPSFDGQKNILAAFKLAAYSMTAGWLAGVFTLLPMLAWLGILGLYGCYVFWIGLPKLMKSPPEKNAVYVIVIIVISIVVSIIPAMVAGSIMGMAGIGAAGLGGYHAGALGVNPAANATFTVNGPDGKASVNLGQMQAAASQMEAQASAMKSGATVKTADPQALLGLMPQSFQGAQRSDTNTSSGGAAGIAASTAEASYALGSGTIHLKVSDIGSMAGVGAMAAAMNLNSTSSSATGYEKITTQNGQMVSEKYNTADKSGDYSVVVGGRISVDAEGNGVDMATLKSLVATIDLGKAQALTQ